MSQRPTDWTAWLNVEGCGFVVVTGLLLVMNAMLLHLSWAMLVKVPWAPLSHAFENPKVGQAIMLVGSVVLVFLQWWVIERLTARWFPWRGKDEPSDGLPSEPPPKQKQR